METLKFLGRESGFKDQNNSAYIEINDRLIIIDCGMTVFNQIKNKFDFNKYNTIDIIITHLHNDHAGSLSQLILYLWFIYNKKVNVISMCKRMQEYLDITGTVKEAYEIKQGMENLTFIKTEHADSIDTYGFKLKVNDKNIVYTGDTNILEPFLPYLNDANEFYVDVSKSGGVHLKIEDVLSELKKIKNNGTEVFLMHIDDEEFIKKVTNREFILA